MANVSQNIFDKTRLFRRLLFQQGKPAGDYELNELQDILHEFQSDTREFTGAFGFWGDAFRVEATGSPNEILIRRGLMLTGDSVILLTEDVTLTNLTTPGSTRTDEVFLHISLQEATKVEYPDIVNPLTGQELARRIQYNISLGVAEDGDYSSFTIPGEDQFICFATLDRLLGSDTVIQSEITDERDNYSKTYLKGKANDAILLTTTGGLGLDLERGKVSIYGNSFDFPGASITVADEDLTYLYLNQSGTLVNTTVRPNGKFLELWRVTAEAGNISSVEDRRRFAPAGLSNFAQDASIRQVAIRDLYPRQNDPTDMKVYVESGMGSYGSVALDFAGGLSPTFVAPSSSTRIDLLYLDGSGLLQIDQGVEGSGVPPFHSGKMPIAEVTIEVGQTEIVDADIRDVRPLFNVGGSSAAIDDGPGTYVLSSGLGLGNTMPKPSWTYGDVTPDLCEITFTASSSTLSWTQDINVRFLTVTGIISNTISGPDSLTGIADGDWVYFDINRSGPSTLTLVRQPGGPPPTFTDHRQIFGQRIGTHFVLQGGQILLDTKPSTYTSAGLDKNRWQALQASVGSPSLSNPFATISQLPANLSDLADVSIDEAAAFNGMNSPSGSNVIATMDDVTAGGSRTAVQGEAWVWGGTTSVLSASVPVGTRYIQVMNRMYNSVDGAWNAGSFFDIDVLANTITGIKFNGGGAGGTVSLVTTVGGEVVGELTFTNMSFSYTGANISLTVYSFYQVWGRARVIFVF